MRRLLQTLLAGLMLAPAPAIVTAETRLIISRNAEVMVVYLSAPLADVSGTVLDGLAPPGDPDTTMRDARESALAATDDVAARLILTVDGAQVPLTAQSAVYHRTTDALSFEDPLDASIASVICATPDARLPEASDLTIYAAWTAPVPLSQGRVALDWNMPDAVPVAVQIRVFERGRLRSDSTTAIGPGIPLDLALTPQRSTPVPPPHTQIVLAVLAMALFLAAAVAWWRSRPSTEALSGATAADLEP